MRTLSILCCILCCIPLLLAHGTPEEHALENGTDIDTDFGPLGGGPNDLAKVLPWNYFLEKKWMEGIFVTLLWVVTIGGIGKVLLLLLTRHL